MEMTPPTPPSPTQSPPAARISQGLLIAGGAALAVLFAPTFDQLFRLYLLDDNYQHGFLVLPGAIALAWWVATKHPLPEQAIGKPSELLGIGLMLLGVFVQFLGILSRFLPIEFLAMALILSGVVIFVGGVTWGRHFAFPIFFLIFMFPLPAALTSAIAVRLQNDVAFLSNEVLGWFFLCYRRGNNIHIAGVDEPMFVAQECSGIRQVTAYIAAAAVYSYLSGFRLQLVRVVLGGALLWLVVALLRNLVAIPWEIVLVMLAIIAACLRVHWLTLVALAVPVAIFANIVRIVLMGVGLVYFGPSWFTTWLHNVPAWFTLPLGIVCFAGLGWLITPSPAPPTTPAAPPPPDSIVDKTQTKLEGQPT